MGMLKVFYRIKVSIKKFYKYLNVKLKIILGFASISKSSEKIGLVQRGDIKSANDYLIKKQF